jgi:hypothetical protein
MFVPTETVLSRGHVLATVCCTRLNFIVRVGISRPAAEEAERSLSAAGRVVTPTVVTLEPMEGGKLMAAVLLALLIVLILFGLGFTLHVLWWIAIIALIIWLLGFLFRVGESATRRRGRWFYW